MICAIVWGETEALGNLNNSLAMNGTGIVTTTCTFPAPSPDARTTSTTPSAGDQRPIHTPGASPTPV